MGSRPTTLYRYFDDAGVLLYVGITTQKHARAHQHWQTAPWWPLVSTATFAHLEPTVDADWIESKAIWDEWPVYNRAGAGHGNIWEPGALNSLESWQERHPERHAIHSTEIAPIVRLQRPVVDGLLILRHLPHRRIEDVVLVHVDCLLRVVEALVAEPPEYRSIRAGARRAPPSAA